MVSAPVSPSHRPGSCPTEGSSRDSKWSANFVERPAIVSEPDGTRLVPAHQLFRCTRPLGFAGGDYNLTRYVSNSPVNGTDPEGLARVVQGYTVSEGGGHHMVPVEIWEQTGAGVDAYRIWDSSDARIDGPDGAGHNYSGHGATRGYSAHVKALFEHELAAYKCDNKIADELTAEHAGVFAKQFLETVRSQGADTFIGGFNDAVRRGGTDGVKKWLAKVGSKLPAPTLGGRRGNGPLGLIDAITVVRDGVAQMQGCSYGTYYFTDASGQYHYETLGGEGIFYQGTDKVYDDGRRDPTFKFWAEFKVWWKSIFDRPTQSRMDRYSDGA